MFTIIFAIGNISNVVTILQKYWLYNGNISNEVTIFYKYRLYIGNNCIEKEKYVLTTLTQYGENTKTRISGDNISCQYWFNTVCCKAINNKKKTFPSTNHTCLFVR